MNLEQYPLLEQYLKPSLSKRLESEHWYENRVIRYVLRESPWVGDLERTFEEANLGTVRNSDEIFGALSGKEAGYDQQLFDAITEVRLAGWARLNNWHDIEKLQKGPGNTPEFRMARRWAQALASSSSPPW